MAGIGLNHHLLPGDKGCIGDIKGLSLCFLEENPVNEWAAGTSLQWQEHSLAPVSVHVPYLFLEAFHRWS